MERPYGTLCEERASVQLLNLQTFANPAICVLLLPYRAPLLGGDHPLACHLILISFQVEHLIDSAGPSLHVITVDVQQVAAPSWPSLGPAVIASAAAEADRALAAGVDTLIMTSRKLVTVGGELSGTSRPEVHEIKGDIMRLEWVSHGSGRYVQGR